MKKLLFITSLILFFIFSSAQDTDSLKTVNNDSIRQDSITRVKKLVSSLQNNLNAYPVIVNGDTLFTVHESPGFNSKKKYAEFVESRIYNVLKRDLYKKSLLNVIDSSGFMIVKYDNLSIVEFSKKTTELLGITNKGAADYAIEHIGMHFDKIQREVLIKKFLNLALYLAIYLLAFLSLRFLYRKVKRWIIENDNFMDKITRLIHMNRVTDEDKERAISSLLPVLKYLYWATIVVLTYFMLPLVLRVFFFTRHISDKMLGYILEPLYDFADGFVTFLPDLIKIIVIVFIFRLFLKLVSYIFNEMKTGGIKVSGFYKEWAQPTGNIVRLVIYAILFAIIFPLIPGSGSDAFKGMSVFIGLLISLGSTSVIANVLSGIIMTYMRPFKIGDRIEADSVTGIVVQKNLLITRIRTPKNVIVTVPNSKILSGHSKNFTTAAERSNLIVHASITIGYDIDWRTVHKLLIESATKTNGIINQSGKEPFVLQKSLDDYYVAYEINAFISQAEKFLTIQSELFRNILDEFNAAGVEIMSPHYRANRNGEDITIPEQVIEEIEEIEEKSPEEMDINEKITAKMEEIEKQKEEEKKEENQDKEAADKKENKNNKDKDKNYKK